MFRPALMIAFAVAAFAVPVCALAKTSIVNLPQSELPCPTNTNEAQSLGAPAVAPPAVPVVTEAANTTSKPGNRASRQRWKALLPGTLKSAG